MLRFVRGPGDPLTDLLDHLIDLIVVTQPRLPQHLPIGAESEFQLLLFREENELVARRAGSAVARGEASHDAHRHDDAPCRCLAKGQECPASDRSGTV